MRPAELWSIQVNDEGLPDDLRGGYAGAADLIHQWSAGTADVGDAAGALILADLLVELFRIAFARQDSAR